MSNKKTVIGIGEVLWDIFPDRKALGGAPANFAYHASQLGLNGMIVSAVGNDQLGEETAALLDEKGIERILQVNGHPTGTVEVCLDTQGVAAYDFPADTAWDYLEFTPGLDALARQTSAVCFGSLAQRNAVSRETIRKFIQAMPEESLKIFDLNLRQNFYSKSLIEDSLRISCALKINEEELAVLSEMFLLKGDETEQVRHLISRYGLKGVILTKGGEGSRIHLPGKSSYLPAREVKIADTVGAGDSFTAAFVVAWLQGKPLEQAHALATDVSAYVCGRQGAMPEIPAEFRQGFESK